MCPLVEARPNRAIREPGRLRHRSDSPIPQGTGFDRRPPPSAPLVEVADPIYLGLKVVRRLTYRYAARARFMQQRGAFALEAGESVSGRRVVVSCDGGRLRVREPKRDKKTRKGRTRYKGA